MRLLQDTSQVVFCSFYSTKQAFYNVTYLLWRVCFALGICQVVLSNQWLRSLFDHFAIAIGDFKSLLSALITLLYSLIVVSSFCWEDVFERLTFSRSLPLSTYSSGSLSSLKWLKRRYYRSNLIMPPSTIVVCLAPCLRRFTKRRKLARIVWKALVTVRFFVNGDLRIITVGYQMAILKSIRANSSSNLVKSMTPGSMTSDTCLRFSFSIFANVNSRLKCQQMINLIK